MWRVISIRRLREFWQEHPDAEAPLRAWYKTCLHAEWRSIQDVRKTYASADAVKVASGATMTVFNIAGNKYRLIASLWYGGGQVYIKQVLTHSQYSKGQWKGML